MNISLDEDPKYGMFPDTGEPSKNSNDSAIFASSSPPTFFYHISDLLREQEKKHITAMSDFFTGV